MARGLATNSSAVNTIGTSFAANKLIELKKNTATNAKSVLVIPQSFYADHIELVAAVASGSPTTVQAMLFWDSTGDLPIAGPSLALDLASALTTASTKVISIRVDLDCIAPPGQTTAGSVYLGLLVDTGTINVAAGGAKLIWRD
jgi:hypothetical protein